MIMSRQTLCRLLFIIVVIFGVLGFSSILSAQGRSQEALEHVKQVQERNAERLMAKEGVVGTAIGLNDNGRDVIVIMLEKSGIPGIPENIEDVPVEVEVTGKIYARQDPWQRFPRPVPIGVSTGHPAITAGTISCRVKDSAGNVFALSNNHVYADENLAHIGDNVLQPGRYDGGINPTDAIGTLYDYQTITFWGFRNTIDAAIAETTTNLLGNSTPAGGYGKPSSTTVQAYVGQPVQKYGRTTMLTHGVVNAVNANVWVTYDSGIARFTKQIVITPGSFSGGGDSGSLIVTDNSNCNPVGLLFAGSDTTTIANPIDLVLERFGVTVDDGTVVNQAPVANAGADQTVNDPEGDGETVILDGSGSYDPDGTIASYEWKEGTNVLGTGVSIEVNFAVGVHTVTLTVTDNGGLEGTDNVTITVTEPVSTGVMHVSNIDMSLSTNSAGPNTFAKAFATITILDASDSPVEGATVYGSWSGASSGSVYGVTDSIGNVTLESANVKNPVGRFTFTVTNVTKNGWTYDSTANDETSDSI
jgi:hypothetical protein